MRPEPVSIEAAFDWDAEMARLGQRDFYAKYGFILLRNLIPAAEIDRLQNAIESEIVPFKGRLYRHRGGLARHQFSDEGLLINALAHPHFIRSRKFKGFTKALRDIIFHPSLGKTLENIDGDPVHVLSQTMLFFICPYTRPHIDSFSLDTWPRGQAHTCWIPLEDVQPDAGPPYVYPAQMDALAMEFPRAHAIWKDENPPACANLIYSAALTGRLEELKAGRYTPELKKGDVIIWSSMTPHGSNTPLRQNASRRAIQAIYWPRSLPYGTYLEARKKAAFTNSKGFNAQFRLRRRVIPWLRSLRQTLSYFKLRSANRSDTP